jgi:hypothetical protein
MTSKNALLNGTRPMPTEPKGQRPRRLTDAERHERFVAMAKEVQADDSLGAFDEAFSRVTSSVKRQRPVAHPRPSAKRASS